MPAAPRHVVMLLVVVAALLGHPAGAAAQRGVPETAVAWLMIDGAQLGPSKDAAAQDNVVRTILGWTGHERIWQDATTERVIASLVSSSLAHGATLQLAVFSMEEERPGADEEPAGELRPIQFRMAISIKSAPEKLRDTLRSLTQPLNDAKAPGGAISRTRVKIADAYSAVEYRRQEWPAWRVIQWVELDGELCFGFGANALQQWLALPEGPAAGQLAVNRAAASDGSPVIEAFLSIDGLRRAFPERFDDDKGARLLEALHLANARSAMAHVRRQPGSTLSIETTWSLRSEPRESAHRFAITVPSEAPADERADPRALLAPDWHQWVNPVLDAYAVLLDEREASTFARSRRAWATRRLPLVARLAGAMEPGASISLDRSVSGVALGALMMRLPLKPDAKTDVVLRDLRTLLDPFADRISTDDKDHTWWLRSKAPAPIRVVSWGLCRAGPAQEIAVAIDLGGDSEWNWKAIARHRRRLQPVGGGD